MSDTFGQPNNDTVGLTATV